MPKYIVKLGNKYFEYSTICDAPITFGMSRDEMRSHLLVRYGTCDADETERRLERCDTKGTSSFCDSSAEDALSCNRAGPSESELTVEQIRLAYCERQPILDGWLPK